MYIILSHRYIRAAFSLVLLSQLLTGCGRTSENKTVMFDGATMGTTYSIQLVKKHNVAIDGILSQEIKDILNSVDSVMSTWRSDSELSRINSMPSGQWISISPDLLFILNMALSISEQTQGAFDITVDPLIELWGFSSNQPVIDIPDEQSVKNAMQQVGYKYLIIDSQRSAIKKNKPIRLNLSAIAKGFAVDKITEHLDKKGIDSYLVEVGGELRFKGNKPDGTGWKIAIETPSVRGRQPERVISISDHAIATSGDYRNYYEINGQRYSHTIDPVTGHPVKNNLASATIIEKNTAYADALATAMMVMGAERGFQFCKLNKIPAYFIIQKDGKFQARYTRYMDEFFIDN